MPSKSWAVTHHLYDTFTWAKGNERTGRRRRPGPLRRRRRTSRPAAAATACAPGRSAAAARRPACAQRHHSCLGDRLLGSEVLLPNHGALLWHGHRVSRPAAAAATACPTDCSAMASSVLLLGHGVPARCAMQVCMRRYETLQDVKPRRGGARLPMNVSGGPYSRLSPALVAVAGSGGPATPGSPAGSRPKRRSSASRLTLTTR